MLTSALKKLTTRINLNFSTETHNNDLQNMLNDQVYKFYNLNFKILMTSHENDL